MPYKLLYFDEVRRDVSEAKAWYKSQQKGLDKRFALEIKTAIEKLLLWPTANAIRYKNVRIAYPKTFPYGIHYYIDDTANFIVLLLFSPCQTHRYNTGKDLIPIGDC